MLRPVRLRHYLAVMQTKGFGEHDVLRDTGVDATRLHDADYLIEPTQCRSVITNMIRLSGDPGIGLDVGQQAEPPDLGIIGYAVMSCRDMRQTLSLWGQYGHSLAGIMSRLEVDPGADSLTIRVVEPSQVDAIYLFCVEEILTMMFKIGGALAGVEPSVTQLKFVYPPPPHSRRYHEIFQCPIHFGATQTSATLGSEWLQTPLKTNDDELNQICVHHCGQILQQIEHSGRLAARLRTLFLKTPSALPRLDNAAHSLSVSPRTLRRQLMDENTSYQKLIDGFRADLAREYLRSTGMAPKEIGYLLGFTDPGTFRRAFKQWTGQTISEYRASTQDVV